MLYFINYIYLLFPKINLKKIPFYLYPRNFNNTILPNNKPRLNPFNYYIFKAPFCKLSKIVPNFYIIINLIKFKLFFF